MAVDNHINLPADSAIAGKVVDSQAQQALRKIDRGWLGVIFGTRDHVPNNVAGLIVVVGFLLIGFLVMSATEWGNVKDQVAGVGAFVTLALGYLFGRASSPN